MQNTEHTVHREAVPVPVQLPEASQEQSIELDYVLPDYYPDFFRLLSGRAEPEITERQIRDGVLEYTLTVRLTVLYCAEQPAAVQAVTQQLTYHKQLPLPQEGAADADIGVDLTAETAYLNCRAVSGRRFDLRGAVRIRARFTGERLCGVLSAAEGRYVQCKTEHFSFVSGLIRTEKPFTLSDDITVSPAQPPLLSILHERVTASVTETRAVSGKLLVKGCASVELLYAAANGMETLHAALPFSQIAEPEGLTDDMPVIVTAAVTGHLITPEAAQDGDLRTLHCDLHLFLDCTAVRTASAPLLTDLYSTVHPCTLRREMLPLLSAPVAVSENHRMKLTLRAPDRMLTKIYAAWAEPESLETVPDEAGCVLHGTLRCTVFAADAAGDPLMLEQKEPITWHLPQFAPAQSLPPLTVASCTYTLADSESVVLQPELLLEGQILPQQSITLLTDAEIDETAQLPQQTDYALRLYYGQAGESVWDIAKRYRTAADAIRAENDCPSDLLAQPQLLLIPSVK